MTGNRAHALASSMPVRAVQARGPPLVLALLLGLVPAQRREAGTAWAVGRQRCIASPPSIPLPRSLAQLRPDLCELLVLAPQQRLHLDVRLRLVDVCLMLLGQ